MRRPWSLRAIASVAAIVIAASAGAQAGEWVSWRGPYGNGVSDETGLPDSWSPEGENLLWTADIISRSTPVVVDGRVCTNGRVGEGIERQERVACFDVATGKLLWEDRFNVYNTTVPFNRVGWASLAADPETGNIFAHGVAGQLNCYDAKGKKLWSRFLAEEIGRLSGYGGRTQTPVVDGEQLILSFVSSNWGATAAPKHRMYSFDKRTGDLNWISSVAGRPYDFNTQSAPVLVDADGMRMIVYGNSDGAIYGLKAQTGEMVWKFQLSKRGINSTVLYNDGVVYASHSEENIDAPVMGRVVAFNVAGAKGEIGSDKELWRVDELQSGFPTPAYKDGTLYVVDNSANLFALNATDGSVKWDFELGTVGKASPVIADGKIYVPETNGRFHILKLKSDGVEPLDMDEVKSEGERYAETYGSVAIADGRVFLTSEGKLYAIGKKGAGKATKTKRSGPKGWIEGKGPVTTVQVFPADVVVKPGESVNFVARGFNAKGEFVGEQAATWTAKGVPGNLSGKTKATFKAAAKKAPAGGTIVATAGGIEASATLRIIPPLPWVEDFESYEVGKVPPTWVGAPGKFVVEEKDGNKVLTKKARPRGLLRNALYMGPSDWSNYQIEADVMGNNKKRRLTDVGVIGAGYTLDLMGNNQILQLRTWPSENRITTDFDYSWEVNVWYRLKLQVEKKDGKAFVRGKVWKKDSPEPADWTMVVEDPLPIGGGSPGLIGYSPADVYFDNIRVTEIR